MFFFRPLGWFGYIVIGIVVALITGNLDLQPASSLGLSVLAVLLWPFILGAALINAIGLNASFVGFG